VRTPTPLRRELLFAFGALFAGAVLLAGMGLAVLLPVLESPAQGFLFLVVLVIADLVILFIFGGALLQRTLVAPLGHLADDARRIASGEYRHRVAASDHLELDQPDNPPVQAGDSDCIRKFASRGDNLQARRVLPPSRSRGKAGDAERHACTR